LGEGPFYDENTGMLYFVDAFVGDFVRMDPKTGVDEKRSFHELVTIIVPYKNSSNEFVVTKWRSMYRLNWDTNSLTYLGEVENGTRFNDGKCDSKGRLWVGTVGAEPGKQGSLWTMDSDLNVVKQATGFTLSNGMTWSLDNKRMFFVDSEARKVYAFDYNHDTGAITNQSILLDFANNSKFASNEVPDGMTIDRTGKLWVACYNGGRIIRVDPESGTVLDEIRFPATKITSLCFGDNNTDTMYVTSAYGGLSDDQRLAQPAAGAVFKVTFESPGVYGFVGERFIN
jgi:sugar lactone lactonase YvrE